MNEFQEGQFVLHNIRELVITYNVFFDIDTNNEVQRGISAVNNFVLSVFEEGALVRRATETLSNQLAFKGDALLDREGVVVF